jgi:hypothetical protein
VIEVVRLAGEWDFANAATAGELIDAASEAGKDIVVDLGETTFIDFTTVRAIGAASARAALLGRGVAIQLPSYARPGVQRLLFDLLPNAPGIAAIVRPTRAAAERLAAQHDAASTHLDELALQLEGDTAAARRRSWQLLQQQEALLARCDQLRLELRASRAARRSAGA